MVTPRRLAAAACLCAAGLWSCAGHSRSRGAAEHVSSSAIERYLGEVEPIRLAVNKLLEGADPILGAFGAKRIPPREAARRMGELELRFASYTVDVAALDPPSAKLHALNASYAATYVLEDSYLSALVAGLAGDKLDGLPDTQSTQRAAIIRSRTELTVLARRAHAPLPADLQQAGRGELAPSLGGS